MSQRRGRGFSTLLVEGESMLPKYSAGDWLLARWGNYGLTNRANRTLRLWQTGVKVGDVVVIERPEQPGIYYVKRIAEMEITKSQIFLLSDNPQGTDSRQWGWLPASAIVATIIARVRRTRSNQPDKS